MTRCLSQLPPSLAAPLVSLAAFIVLGTLAARRFRGDAVAVVA